MHIAALESMACSHGQQTKLNSDMSVIHVLYLLLFVCLGIQGAVGNEPNAGSGTSVLPARRHLQGLSLFEPLANLISAQEQQEHSLMHMMSSHRATDSLLESSSSHSDPIGLDIAEAILEDQPQIQANDRSESPEHARLHSLDRSQALAKSKSSGKLSHQGSSTAHTSLPMSVTAVSELSGRNLTELLSTGERVVAPPADCAALIEHEAVRSCLISRLASLNAELEALSAGFRPQASIGGASAFQDVLLLQAASSFWVAWRRRSRTCRELLGHGQAASCRACPCQTDRTVHQVLRHQHGMTWSALCPQTGSTCLWSRQCEAGAR